MLPVKGVRAQGRQKLPGIKRGRKCIGWPRLGGRRGVWVKARHVRSSLIQEINRSVTTFPICALLQPKVGGRDFSHVASTTYTTQPLQLGTQYCCCSWIISCLSASLHGDHNTLYHFVHVTWENEPHATFMCVRSHSHSSERHIIKCFCPNPRNMFSFDTQPPYQQ